MIPLVLTSFAMEQNCMNYWENRALANKLVVRSEPRHQTDHQILLFITCLFKQVLSTFQNLNSIGFLAKI